MAFLGETWHLVGSIRAPNLHCLAGWDRPRTTVAICGMSSPRRIPIIVSEVRKRVRVQVPAAALFHRGRRILHDGGSVWSDELERRSFIVGQGLVTGNCQP